MPKNPPFQTGWTPRPDGRGTLDIIWTSVVTISFCSWTVLCLNVPARGQGFWQRLLQKTLLTVLSICGPEFILQLTMGQWASARCSVEQFCKSSRLNWMMKHAFLADMGGFVPCTPNNISFPLDAKQVHYLVEKKYLPYSEVAISKETIADKNKREGMVRFITVCQTLWFALNCIARAVQGLAITTLELTTIGFIICTLATFYFWAQKPSDVTTAIMIEIDIPMSEILIRAGNNAQRPYSHTPLDFVSREETLWNRYWTH